MGDFDIVYQGNVLALYYQVAMLDARAKESYPEWKTGEESVIFGLHGVAVATAGDQEIEVLVCRGKGNPEHVLCVSGEIIVSSDQGIIVGNVPAANTTSISLQRGIYSVTVYTNGIRTEATRVYFFIEFLTPLKKVL